MTTYIERPLICGSRSTAWPILAKDVIKEDSMSGALFAERAFLA